jgi:NADH dehydrogenase FAD-containing subunit
MKRIVIIGAGFAGLAAAKALRHANADVLVIDRANHNLFQPLLYQVATTVLSPAQIASPIRGLLKNQRNTTVFLGEVSGINKDAKFVYASDEDHKDAALGYDILVIATGVAHSYFGHDEFAEFAPGLKGLADAVRIRNKVLKAFELAEAEDDPSRRQELLTFVLVGAGPTGVELASSLAVLVRTKLKAEFRRINLAATRIVLVDMAPRVLGTFASELSEAAKHRLETLGVEVRLGHSVDQIDADGVVVGGERIASKVVIWTAGVAPSPAGKWLNVETDRAGRVRIQDDLTVPGHPDIYVIGDTASLEQDGKPLPGVAQVAIQQGRYAGRRIAQSLNGKPFPKPFRYFDKGNMAVIGAGFAILQAGKVRLSGLVAWLAWAGVHLQFLATSSLRLTVFLQWIWSFLTGQTGVRLIVNHIPLSNQNKDKELPIASRGREMTRQSRDNC